MFRQEYLELRKKKWEGNALLLPNISNYLIILCCIFFIFVFFIFLILGTYTRREYVIGEVSSSSRPSNIVSTVQGVVVEKYVENGDFLKKNTPIYKIDVSKNIKEGKLNSNQILNINNQLKIIEEMIGQLNENKTKTLKNLENQKNLYIRTLKESEILIEQVRNSVSILKKSSNDYNRYLSKGLITQEQYLDKVYNYTQQNINYRNLINQHDQLNIQISNIDNQINTQRADFNNQINQIELKYFELKNESLNISSNGEIIIKSSIEGRISSLSVGVGEMVSVGDSLLQIESTNNSHFQVVFWVPNTAIPYIKIGEKIKIKYEAFPYQKFGFFSGKILYISKVPGSSQEIQTYKTIKKSSLDAGEPLYKVVVSIKDQTIKYENRYLNFVNGIKAEGVFFLERRYLYQWIFTPLFNIKNSI